MSNSAIAEPETEEKGTRLPQNLAECIQLKAELIDEIQNCRDRAVRANYQAETKEKRLVALEERINSLKASGGDPQKAARELMENEQKAFEKRMAALKAEFGL